MYRSWQIRLSFCNMLVNSMINLVLIIWTYLYTVESMRHKQHENHICIPHIFFDLLYNWYHALCCVEFCDDSVYSCAIRAGGTYCMCYEGYCVEFTLMFCSVFSA